MELLLGTLWLLLAQSVTACSHQDFTCGEGLCVALDTVCDFTEDCGDGSDEENCKFTFEILLLQTSSWT